MDAVSYPPTVRAGAKTLIAFATRWGTKFGGINSFNMDLIGAFAAACYEQATTICVVLSADEYDRESALNEQVYLVSLDRSDQKEFSSDLESVAWHKIQGLELNFNCDGAVWLGHDRITGAIAVAAAKKRGGRSALIHHMSYSRYESFAENSKTAKAKENEQSQLFECADLAMAVGPLLSDSLSDMRSDQNIFTLIPGLPDILVKGVPKVFKGFLSGRLSEDASRIKQAYLGVASFADSIRQSDENPGLPSFLRGENEPMLILRGVDFENSHAEINIDAEKELKLFAEQYSGRAFNLQALPFTTDRDELFNDLRSASVAMMPSWHEGFGLVAWEAIAAGVPLIVSKKSGVYRFLKSFNDGLYISCVTPIDIAGSSTDPYFLPKDVNELAQALINIAKEPQIARQKAARLREALISEYTWADCAKQIVGFLGWEVGEHLSEISAISEDVSLVSEVSVIGFLELPRPRWSATAGLSISQLLRAEEAIIPFDSKREPFLASQIEWVESDYPIAVRLLTGAGGVGKTRLALEMCLKLTRQGWSAGFLTSECGVEQSEKFVQQLINSSRPCCVVIDYAETRQSVLLSIITALLKKPVEKNVRILLLARDGGEWWTALPAKDAVCEALLEGDASSGPFLLPQLHDSELERQQAYSTALKIFADITAGVKDQHLPNMEDAHFARPLYIQMAALMALRGERPRSAESLQRAVVNHEKRYWGKALSLVRGDSVEYERQAALLMTLATFSNGIATERSIEKAWVAAGENKSQLRRVFTSLSSLYPDRQGLQGLRPDLIGEALVAQSLLARDGAQIIDIVISGEKRLRRSSFTVLARLLRNRADLFALVEGALIRRFVLCIDEVIAVCIETPSPLPEIFQSAYEKLSKPQKLQAAGILEKRLHHEVLQLTTLDVLVSKTITEKKAEHAKKRNKEEDVVGYGRALNNLAVALIRDGKSDEALIYARQSVEVYRQFKNSKTSFFKSCFAGSLLTYANRLDELGESDEALSVVLESIDIYRSLNKEEADSYNLELASTINSYANFLDGLGRTDEAVIAVKESLDIYDGLVPDSSSGVRESMTSALNNYANYLDAEGRTEEASAIARRNMDISRELAATNPNRFQSKYAIALYNYSEYLSIQGNISEALSSCEQALNIYRDLAKVKPNRFEANIARGLRGYADRLYDAGRFDDALTEYETSLSVCRSFFDLTPLKYKTELAFSLIGYSHGLANCGKINDALAATQNAVLVLGDLVEINPGYYLPELEKCKIEILLWKWLISGQYIAEEIERELPVIINVNERRSVEFRRAWLLACLCEDLELILVALNCFSLLNSTQQRADNEKAFILIEIFRRLHGDDAVPKKFQEMSGFYREKTKGVFPLWVFEMARAYGFTI
ncbi:tetratricopeptide repeat protein [Pseudomonas sp. Marseille-Q1929]|uniref:tetratricopeptide repeat protein n=1 Tax=Pseudomonas sp. Marseille-Q1929 TaxID=2730402 RepID=UPI001A8D7675|nr:tetratricopeptide repeat protein [Pseudomonas sp. Marseille-Q1929]MBO0496882.1 tetratricopeptide repeat protein [Pseudomonas sp. Marseille-Q1929]